MAVLNHNCARCGGSLYKDDEGYHCFGCERTWGGKDQLHDFYELHKDQIIATARVVGIRGTAQSWLIPEPTVKTILYRWQVGDIPDGRKKDKTAQKSKSPGSTAGQDRSSAVSKSETPVPTPQSPKHYGPPDIKALARALKVLSLSNKPTVEIDLSSMDDDTFWQTWYTLGKVIRNQINKTEVPHAG